MHLAVIMDGNRRWAKLRGLASTFGHREGVEALKKLVKACPKYNIQYLTVYAFSTENWKRNSQELDFLFGLLSEMAVSQLATLLDENVKVNFIGDIKAFDKNLEEKLENLKEKTKNNKGLNLQIALNYGAIDEFRRALIKIKNELNPEEIKTLTTKDFSKFLDCPEVLDPEILIRTGGEGRLSNYLLWQSTNSELHFIDTLWPDFSEEHLKAIVGQYSLK